MGVSLNCNNTAICQSSEIEGRVMKAIDFNSAFEISKAIEENIIAYFSYLDCLSNFKFYDTYKTTWFISDIPNPRFNRILKVIIEHPNMDYEIETMLTPFRSRNIPMLWHIGPSTKPHDLKNSLAKHNLQWLGDEVGMYINLSNIANKPTMPPSFRLLHVDNTTALKKWCDAFSQAFDVSKALAGTFFEVESNLMGRFSERRLYVGLMGDEPVGVATLNLSANVAGLYSIGTVPNARGKGIGTFMTIGALLDAYSKGYQIGTLYASRMGMRMYERIGFDACPYCVFGRYFLPAQK